MTEKEAYRILGLVPGTGIHEIKKRYRQLILTAHPDTGSVRPVHDAQKLNAAYSVLKKGIADSRFSHLGKGNGRRQPDSEAKKHTDAWDAPVNSSAYREREILHYAEDQEGTVLGTFCIARGKYLWKVQEDFPLFLLSIYRCSARILDEMDDALSRSEAPACRLFIQAELSYLLARQFIDASEAIQELAQATTADSQGQPVYRFSAMLEYGKNPATGQAGSPFGKPFIPGEPLYPSALRRHRLFLKNREGHELGYLSFPDDRLYYIIIPLFEQKRVQVRIQTASGQTSRPKTAAAYQNLKLWLRFSDESPGGLSENLNLRIERLLEIYRSPGQR